MPVCPGGARPWVLGGADSAPLGALRIEDLGPHHTRTSLSRCRLSPPPGGEVRATVELATLSPVTVQGGLRAPQDSRVGGSVCGDSALCPGSPRSPAHRTAKEPDLEGRCGGHGHEPGVGRGAGEGTSQRDRACGVGGPPPWLPWPKPKGQWGLRVQLAKGDPPWAPSGPATVAVPAPGDRTLGGFVPAPAKRWHSLLLRPGLQTSLRRGP